MASRKLLAGFAMVVAVVVPQVATLQCWKCSSDIDRQCNDRFNASDILTNRGGFYDNVQPGNNYNNQNQGNNYNNQNQNQNQRQYDQNYNQNYNRNFQQQGQSPVMESCDENEARLRRMKNVCLKKVIRGNNYVSIIRRCAMIAPEETVGTCHDPVSRGLTLEFCEYCETEGCNSANGIKTSFLLTLMVSIFSFLLIKF